MQPNLTMRHSHQNNPQQNSHQQNHDKHKQPEQTNSQQDNLQQEHQDKFNQKRSTYIASAKSSETRRAIDKHWRSFSNWCATTNEAAFPCSVNTLERYLIECVERGYKNSTIDQIKWAIDYRHRHLNHNAPGSSEAIKLLIAGIKRSNRSAIHQKKAISPDIYSNYNFAKDLYGTREKVVILLGFASGLRRSELARIKVEDITFTTYGIRIRIPYSKTNQEGSLETVDVVYGRQSELCPVVAVREWIALGKIEQSYLLRRFSRGQKITEHKLSECSVNNIVKQFISKLVPDPENYGCHSLRAGFATYMLNKKVPLNVVAKQLRHKKPETTLRYDRGQVADSLTGIY